MTTKACSYILCSTRSPRASHPPCFPKVSNMIGNAKVLVSVAGFEEDVMKLVFGIVD